MKKQNWLFVIAVMIAVMVMGAGSSFAAGPYYWDGAGGVANEFNDVANWTKVIDTPGTDADAFQDADEFIFNDLVPGDLNLTCSALAFAITITVTDQTGLVTITPTGILEIVGIDMSGAVGVDAALTIADGSGLILQAGTAIAGKTGKPIIIADNIDQNGQLITVTGDGADEISGILDGAGGLTLNSTGSLKLSGANTAATGAYTLTAGTLEIDDGNAINAGSALNLDGGIFKITTGIPEGSWPTAIAIGASDPIIQNDASTTVCDVALNCGANDFTIQGSQNIEIKAGITGAGAGIFTVAMTASSDIVKFTTANNTNTGISLVNGGTVLFNNTNTSAITVGVAGVLGGTGTVTGAIIVNGKLNPGDPGASSGVGELTAEATVVFNDNSVFELDVVNAAFDELTATGNITFNASPDQ